MNRFLVTGAVQRKNAAQLSPGQRFEKAILKRIDWENRYEETLLEYVTPPNQCPKEFPSILFTGASKKNNKLYLPTSTEVLILKYPDLEIINRISYPCFHDIHHVQEFTDYIAVLSTGLDLVIFLDKKNYKPISYNNVLFEDPWKYFSVSKDYRLINSTKPHRSHPNWMFEIEDELWVTRFEQKDAICLEDPKKRIDIKIERCHDGIVVEDFVYFTTVDGHIVIAHKFTHKIEQVINLNKIGNANTPLGWCRGINIVGRMAFVGFSRIRQTKIKENLRWLKNSFFSGDLYNSRQTRIVQYDIQNKKKISEFVFDDISMIFTIINDNED